MTTKTILLGSLLTLCFYLSLEAQEFDLYISDAGNFNNPPWQILKFDENGENGAVFTTENLAWPQDIVFLEDQHVALISNLNSGVIARHHAETGAFISNFATGIAGPTRMEIGPDSLLYVLQWQGAGKVKRYTLSGAFVDDFTEVGINSSIGIAWDTGGNLYISSYYGKFVQKFSPSGANMGKIISTNLLGPTNIWFAENGDLMVVDYNGAAVKRFDANGNYQGIFISNLPQGEGVDCLPNGNIIIGCGGSSSVMLFDKDGIFIKDLIPGSTLGLKTPNAVVLRPKGLSGSSTTLVDMTLVTPNFGHHFKVTLPDNLAGIKTLELYQANGRLVKRLDTARESFLDARQLTNGVYYLTAKMEDGKTARQKIVVQH